MEISKFFTYFLPKVVFAKMSKYFSNPFPLKSAHES